MSISNDLSKERIEQLKIFQKKYNLKFKNISLLNQAFCHTSYTQENSLEENLSYERLEFLGDAVLKLSVSEILYCEYPNSQEGRLTKIRGELVSDKNIFKFAQKLGFEELIILGKNERKHGGAKKESILACAFEAFLGAIFLEYKTKGYQKALEFLKENFLNEILEMEKICDYLNPKSILQEYTQGLDGNRPEYILIKEEGLAHDKTFYIEARYNNKTIGFGNAKSIKSAQQEAALDAVKKLKILKEN